MLGYGRFIENKNTDTSLSLSQPSKLCTYMVQGVENFPAYCFSLTWGTHDAGHRSISTALWSLFHWLQGGAFTTPSLEIPIYIDRYINDRQFLDFIRTLFSFCLSSRDTWGSVIHILSELPFLLALAHIPVFSCLPSPLFNSCLPRHQQVCRPGLPLTSNHDN